MDFVSGIEAEINLISAKLLSKFPHCWIKKIFRYIFISISLYLYLYVATVSSNDVPEKCDSAIKPQPPIVF